MTEWYDIVFLGGMTCIAFAELFDLVYRNIDAHRLERGFWWHVWVLVIFIIYSLWRLTNS